MTTAIEFDTERLRLRQWHHADYARFAQMNADPTVMAFFPKALSANASDALAHRCALLIEAQGWGLWAAEEKASGHFIGFIGLHASALALPFAPCVEVGWRLAARYWGQGFATEGARGALRVGFEQLGLREIVSFTARDNTRSLAVMRRLGMREAGWFEHPLVPQGHPLRPHVLYRLSSEDYDAQRSATSR